MICSPNVTNAARCLLSVRRVLMLGSVGVLWLGSPAPAATQTWLGDGGSGGTGSWATGTDWSPNTWVAGNSAIFGGTAGTVTVGTQTASGLTFNVGGYSLDAGTLTLNTGSVVTTTSGTTTFTSALNLAGAAGDALTKTGAGTLSLATSNSGLGTAASPAVWTVNGGTLSGGIFSSVLSVTLGNNLGASPTTASTQLILDSGTLEVRGSGATNTNTVGSTRTIQVNPAGGAIHDISGFSNTYNDAISDNAASNSSLYLANTAGTATFAGVVSGNGSLTWNGAGTVAPTGTNTYSGGTTINSGTVSFTTNANLGANSGAVTLSGGTLGATAATALSGSSAGVFAHSIATGTVGGTIDVAAGGVFGLNYFNQNTTGDITGSGPLTKTSAGQLIVSGNNSAYSGNWTINGGLVEVQYNGSTSLGSGSVTLAAGTELALNYGNTISNAISSSGGTLSFAVGGNGTYSGAIALTAGTTSAGLRDFYNTSNAENGSFTGVISGSGALATAGGGTLTLSGTNTYSGGTTINTGTISFSSNSNLGANSGAVTLGGGTLSDTGSLTGGAASVFAHNIATGTVGGTIDVAAGGALGLNYFNQNTTGDITGSGPLTKTSAGQLIVSGNNSAYSGNWTINGGLVEVQYNGSTSLGTGAVTLAAGTEMALDYANTISNAINSAGGTISFANSSGGVYSGAVALTSGTTTVGLRDFYNAGNARSGSITGVISGAGTLATSGGGILTLTAANTYTGATAVNAGTLLVNGNDASATGVVAVNNSGTLLGGTGTVGGATTVNTGAQITGGALGAVGTLTLTGGLTLTSGSTYAVDISGTSSDKLTINGTLSSSGATIAINSGTLDGRDTYVIAAYTSDSGSTFTLSNASGYSLLDTGTVLELVPTAVPEPGTALCGGLLLLVAGWQVWRRSPATGRIGLP